MSDATVVGAGPNGLAAAVTLARAGLSVDLYERAATVGGGSRTLELTLPGFRHDLGAAVHPMAFASPFFQAFGLDRRIEFAVPEVSYAHPLDSSVGIAFRSLDETVDSLGADGRAWRSLFAPLIRHIDGVTDFTGSQLLRMPRQPLIAARFGLRALEQGSGLWNLRFRGDLAPAMLTGVMAHSIGRLPSLTSAGVGLTLAAHAHARGWPIPVGGSQSIMDALLHDFTAHGGTLHLDTEITDIRDLPPSTATLMDVSARSLALLGGSVLPERYLRLLNRFRYGDGVAKVDFALSSPVPWRFDDMRRAGTIHLGGGRRSLVEAEATVASGRDAEQPFVLVSQPSLFDPSRAPDGHHTLWAYAHTPGGSTTDATETITSMIERDAPGFRDTILASSAISAAELAIIAPNFVGGDIASGALTLPQMLARPTFSPRPWRTPHRGLYLASSSTPPATGVHGLSGFYAARTALHDLFNLPVPPLAP